MFSHALRTMSILLYIGGDVHCINQVPSYDTYLIPSALLLGGIPILFLRQRYKESVKYASDKKKKVLSIKE